MKVNISDRVNTFGLRLNDVVQARLCFAGPRLTVGNGVVGKILAKWASDRLVSPSRSIPVATLIASLSVIESVNGLIKDWKLDGYVKISFEVETDPLGAFVST